MKTGIELITAEQERVRSVEGYSAAHDDTHRDGELKMAGVCYALGGASPKHNFLISEVWPWSIRYWKPKSEIQNLVRAGQLLVAEIDRLLREEERERLNQAAAEERP